MRPSVRVLIAVAALSVGAACASMSSGARDETTFTTDLGRVSFDALARAVQEVLHDRNGYALRDREEQYAALYYATEWLSGTPSAEESRSGVTGARSRIVLRGRRTGGEYRLTFHGERRVRGGETTEWRRAPIPDDFARRMSGIADALEAAIRAGEAPDTDTGRRSPRT